MRSDPFFDKTREDLIEMIFDLQDSGDAVSVRANRYACELHVSKQNEQDALRCVRARDGRYKVLQARHLELQNQLDAIIEMDRREDW